MWSVSGRRGVCVAAMLLSFANWQPGTASAADWGVPDQAYGTLYRPDRWELRPGGFAHGVGSIEQSGGYDFGLDIVVPRLFMFDSLHEFFSPRIHFGGMANFAGRTSYAYAGFLHTFNLTQRLFIEGFYGVALHNGSATGDATHSALGCKPLLIHSGGNLGFRFTQNWSVMVTLDHLSHGHLCSDRNQGVNNYGARIGYTF
jgi:lipid A 3-O-deacylase